MRCEICRVEMIEREATVEHPYIYKISGLKDLHLVGIACMHCPKCSYDVAKIPYLGELHQAISLELIKKPSPLLGDEIRFMRKHARIPQKDFSQLLCITQSHLSRVENGHTTQLGDATERLARAIVATIAKDGDAARQVLLSLSRKMGQAPFYEASHPTFTLEEKVWRIAA